MPGDFVAGLLIGAAQARRQVESAVVVDLAWTGPTTPYVSTRRTDQILLDIIREAKEKLFLVAFVVYDVGNVVQALNDAISRGVEVKILLDTHGKSGRGKGSALAVMRSAVLGAEYFDWDAGPGSFAGGRVHAKVAVADYTTAFVTSANLTGYALGKNMEAGIHISGGSIPRALHSHLEALVVTRVVRPI